ncbi:MAG TPA: helix-turn-helix transcriptional regulator [Kofleriaceae bacterium]
MSVGEILKAAREKLGKTQAQVAAELSKTQATISEWERNKSLPKTDEIREVALVYAVAPEAILPLNPRGRTA